MICDKSYLKIIHNYLDKSIFPRNCRNVSTYEDLLGLDHNKTSKHNIENNELDPPK